MKVYVAMPINTASGYDPTQMFQEVGEFLRSRGLHPTLPSDDVDPQIWDMWMSDHHVRNEASLHCVHLGYYRSRLNHTTLPDVFSARRDSRP